MGERVPGGADGGVDSGLNEGAVNDKPVHCDLAWLRWTGPGPAGRSARPRSSRTIWRAPGTSLARLSVTAAQPATARERISATKAA